jgi:hypothetical protein
LPNASRPVRRIRCNSTGWARRWWITVGKHDATDRAANPVCPQSALLVGGDDHQVVGNLAGTADGHLLCQEDAKASYAQPLWGTQVHGFDLGIEDVPLHVSEASANLTCLPQQWLPQRSVFSRRFSSTCESALRSGRSQTIGSPRSPWA